MSILARGEGADPTACDRPLVLRHVKPQRGCLRLLSDLDTARGGGPEYRGNEVASLRSTAMRSDTDLTRRDFVVTTTAASLTVSLPDDAFAATAARAGCSLTINGQRYDLQLEPRETLLDVLRERLHLTGSKKGCDHGQCGACTVLADGVRILSCLTLAITQDGKQITTIEGIASGENLHPLQSAFIEQTDFNVVFVHRVRFARHWRC